MVNISVNSVIRKFLPSLLLVIFFSTYYQMNDNYGLFYVLVITWLFVIIATLKKDFSNIVFSFFMVSFFAFLLGRMCTVVFFRYTPSYTGVLGTAFSSGDTVKEILLILFLSIMSLYIGFSINILNRANDEEVRKSNTNLTNIKLASKLLYYFSFIFRLVVLFEMIRATKTTGYYESFSTFNSTLPGILVIFSEMYDVALFVFLSCMPTKKESVFLIYLYILEGIMSLISGRRVEFLLNTIIILIYIFYRHNKNKDEHWISKRIILVLFLVTPILFIVLNMIGDVRGSNFTATSEIENPLKKFFFSQGISVNVIGYTIEFLDSLPNQNYSFGPVIEFFKTKIIDIFSNSNYSLIGQTVQRAMEGNLYSHTISYYIMPDLYLRGIGYGSSYVAELFKDYSLFGVFIGNIVYGCLFRNCFSIVDRSNPFLRGIIFLMIRQMMFAPRNSFTNFLVASISTSKILAIIIIYILSLILMEFSNRKEMTLD